MFSRGEAHSSASGHKKHGYSAERGFSAAFELVATPALFAFFGYFIDGRLGTAPVFTLVLPGLVTCYLVWKLWYQYNAEMIKLEAELIASRGTGTANKLKIESDDSQVCL